jgi:hypothetical protein
MRELDPEKVYDAALRLMSVDYPFKEGQPAEKQPAAVLETEFPPLGFGEAGVVRREADRSGTECGE